MEYIKKINFIKRRNFNFKKNNVMNTNCQDIEKLKNELQEINKKDLKRISMVNEGMYKDESVPLTVFVSFLGIIVALLAIAFSLEEDPLDLNAKLYYFVSFIIIMGGVAFFLGCFSLYFRNLNMKVKFIQIAIKEIEEEREEANFNSKQNIDLNSEIEKKELSNIEKHYSKIKISLDKIRKSRNDI